MHFKPNVLKFRVWFWKDKGMVALDSPANAIRSALKAYHSHQTERKVN